MLVVLLLVGALVIFAQSSAIAPFIYTLFQDAIAKLVVKSFTRFGGLITSTRIAEEILKSIANVAGQDVSIAVVP